MTKYCRNKIINGKFNILVDNLMKLVETYTYKIWCLNYHINVIMNKPLPLSKKDICRLLELNIYKVVNKNNFKAKFRETINDSRIQISLV